MEAKDGTTGALEAAAEGIGRIGVLQAEVGGKAARKRISGVARVRTGEVSGKVRALVVAKADGKTRALALAVKVQENEKVKAKGLKAALVIADLKWARKDKLSGSTNRIRFRAHPRAEKA